MKREKIKYILLIILVGIILITPQAYAKTSIEIKPSTTVYTNKTISEFFDESIAMKNVGEGLEGSDVDVHMATNTDWAIVSYFSNSAYGTNGEGGNTGVTISINGTDYLSTNGNVTGVMNFGKMDTYTSGVISNYAEISDDTTVWANGRSIIANATNNIYVDLINNLSIKQMAAYEYGTSWGKYFVDSNISSPYCARLGLFRWKIWLLGMGKSDRWTCVDFCYFSSSDLELKEKYDEHSKYPKEMEKKQNEQ